MNDIEKMTRMAQKAMQDAANEAETFGNPSVEPEHLIKQVVSQEGGIVPQVLMKMQVSLRSIEQKLQERIDHFPKISGSGVKVVASQNLVKLFKQAEKEAKAFNDDFISTEHFLLAGLKTSTEIQRLFEQNGVSQHNFLTTLKDIRGEQRITDDSPEDKFDALNKYGRDLTKLAEEGKLDPVVGRDDEIRRVIQVLSRRTKNNPVLIGEPGVGKTAIAEGLAVRIINQDVPDVLFNRRLITLDIGALLAG
ncbi:MAG: type VI secretion system ATPase TssH, partial [Bdellovibrionales bacterium]|nr:type VI secretion system ATPase TssH [Bdellovibrionales bacterium]